jgi:hypothetical protein
MLKNAHSSKLNYDVFITAEFPEEVKIIAGGRIMGNGTANMAFVLSAFWSICPTLFLFI